MEKLRECPFCGTIPCIGICDDEGNDRNEDYEEDPYSGLWFRLLHEVKNTDDCPIATYTGENLGTFLYETRDELIAAWNRRALPEDAIREAAEEIARYIVHHTHSAFGNVAGDWDGRGIESIIRRHLVGRE